jgi:hypothetical protein
MKRLFLRLGLAAPVALSGCYASDIGPSPDYSVQECSSGIALESIDTGQVLVLDPGVGAGATVEYLGNGAWRFATACDTSYSGNACHWQLSVTPEDGASISDFAPEGLEGDDSLGFSSDGAPGDGVSFDGVDDYDLDGFVLDATPGATLEISVKLDGACGGPFMGWIQGGQVVTGLSQVNDLTPTAP